jgi:putative membrane protein
MTSRFSRLSLILAAALAGTVPLSAADLQAATPQTQTPAALQAADLSFVLHAAEGGQAEVALGKLASEKATDDNVKQFGDMMAKDHSMANKELAGIASAKGTTPPNEPGSTAVAIEQTLAALAADGFDREYMAQQVGDHVVTLALFRNCAESCIDPEIKAFAQKSVPMIEGHLKEAQNLLSKAKQQASAQ